MLKFVKNKNDFIWLEPAGGTGQFVNAMLQCGIKNIEAYDIDPRHQLVKKTDNFLNEQITGDNYITLTNPPYGRANSLCVPFFNHCARNSKYIGFLVPKSWRKWSVQNKLDFHFHLVHDAIVKTDFVYEDENRSKGKLATVFQIWERRDKARCHHAVEDRGYIKKTTPDLADVSLTVFGRGCGTVKTDFKREKNTTQMFLKLKEPWVLDALKTVDFSRFYNNVAFIEALSFAEIMYLLNEYRDKQIGDGRDTK
jgi:predicted RNA methylase